MREEEETKYIQRALNQKNKHSMNDFTLNSHLTRTQRKKYNTYFQLTTLEIPVILQVAEKRFLEVVMEAFPGVPPSPRRLESEHP